MSRTILVTGCSSGIGRHCAMRLKEEGWRVVATARREEDCRELEATGLVGLNLEYRDSDSIRAAFARALVIGGGRLDALFNNGAFAQPGAVEDVSRDLLREQFEANVFGWHELTQLAVAQMRSQEDQGSGRGFGRGRIVHCSSILGLVAYRWRGAYVASKFALEGLMSAQRLELIGSGIHMSLIEPGPIVSRIGQNSLARFRATIDPQSSVHRETYRDYLARLEAGGGVNRFRLTPEAVHEKLRHALESGRPRAHYPVTVPAHFMAWMRSILPQRLLDRLLTGSD
jgi:NAD(P)-dependent dehydrogenase (short-subunit alcohol dehydrogenase family)